MIEEKTVARDELLNRISIKTRRLLRQAMHQRHTYLVSLILDFLASGMSPEEVLNEYPDLTLLDIQACLAYGAEMSRERYVPIPITSPG